jgi:hypothetical protein
MIQAIEAGANDTLVRESRHLPACSEATTDSDSRRRTRFCQESGLECASRTDTRLQTENQFASARLKTRDDLLEGHCAFGPNRDRDAWRRKLRLRTSALASE